MHFARFFDKDFLSAPVDLTDENGKALSAVVTIEAVEQGEVQSPGRPKKKRAPVLRFLGRKKRLILNVTNCRALAEMFGPDTRDWPKKRITIFASTTQFGPDTVPCIRIRPEAVSAKAADSPEKAEAPVAVAAEITTRTEPK